LIKLNELFHTFYQLVAIKIRQYKSLRCILKAKHVAVRSKHSNLSLVILVGFEALETLNRIM